MTNNINIEQEYNNYISGKWQKLSETTKDILKLDGEPKRNYVSAMSMWTIQFLQDKLKSLEIEKR